MEGYKGHLVPNFRRFSLTLKRNGSTQLSQFSKESENTANKENIITRSLTQNLDIKQSKSTFTRSQNIIVTKSPVPQKQDNIITKNTVIRKLDNIIAKSPVIRKQDNIIAKSPVIQKQDNIIAKSPLIQKQHNIIAKSIVTRSQSNLTTKSLVTQSQNNIIITTKRPSTLKKDGTISKNLITSNKKNGFTKNNVTTPKKESKVTNSLGTINKNISKTPVQSHTQKDDFVYNFDDFLPNKSNVIDVDASTITLLSTKEDENIIPPNKEISNYKNISTISQNPPRKLNTKFEDSWSFEFSAIQDLETQKDTSISSESFCPVVTQKADDNSSLISVSSATELTDRLSESTITYEVQRPLISVSFGVNNCKTVEVGSTNSVINRFLVSHNDTGTNINCDLLESQISTNSIVQIDENMNESPCSQTKSQKRPSVIVNLEIKKQKLTHDDTTENSKVLILNTNAIEKISHVIVQPPNYKFAKRDNFQTNKSESKLKTVQKTGVKNGDVNVGSVKLKQTAIDSFFTKPKPKHTYVSLDKVNEIGCERKSYDEVEMNKNSGVIDAVKYDRVGRNIRAVRKESNESPKSAKLPAKRETLSPKRDIKTSNSEAQSPRLRNESASSHSRKNVDSIHFSLHTKSVKSKVPLSPKNIPHHKIVAGTHFAVDAFSYGEIPNVKHYFLTHFHSDHYSGLKKGFNKLLFCSKITADLCISRLGVNPKCIHIMNVDETLRVDSVEVTAVDANHCPGALMLVFTLPNGKTLLHTGDFRACPYMESYPVFWNKDIHTIYLDTTYCNPRYDFPTQDQSLEMALNILRQKKMSLEKDGKKFSSVLIVCGTYTIGKEKFFLGMARRVGCSVWACPEKERVLQTVEGRVAGARPPPPPPPPPHAAQLHVVPMRDLTHEKLRSYLGSVGAPFAEVVAFKPSGWESGKGTALERDQVTIHGIPYSEHSSFSELVRFVKFLKPKQVVPTVDISCGVKAVQKYFPCPLVCKEGPSQAALTDYFPARPRQPVSAVT